MPLLVLSASVGLGALAGALFAIAAPAVSVILGAGTAVTFDLSLSLPFGIAFGLNTMTLVIGLACLVPLGAARAVFWNAVAGAVAVVPGLAIGIAIVGAVGAAWAVAGAQVAVMAAQLAAVLRVARR